MTRIGRYEIVGELGRGAMGVVYQATDPAIGRSLAIKVIRILEIQDADERRKLRDRLFREARSAGALSHTNIVTIYDMDEADGVAWIAMAHVKGPTLEKSLAAPQPLPGPRILHILRQLAAALDYAHIRGVVHRDIKPANIMTDDDDVLKITDFGIARINGASATETRTVVGTPYYMSPEQVQGRTITGGSDQFSLAVVAYEMLTGERPFHGDDLGNILYKIVHEEPIPPRRINGTLAPVVDAVLRRALAKAPADRFANCCSFVAALETALGESRDWLPMGRGGGRAMPALAEPNASRPVPAAGFAARLQDSLVRPALLLAAFIVAGVVVWESGLIGNGGTASGKDAVTLAPAPPDREQPLGPAPEILFGKPSPMPALAADIGEPPARDTAADAGPAARVTAPSGVLQYIWLSTDPAGATAVLDDRPDQSCQTPCTLLSRSGVHRLAISLEGYMYESREVHVGAGALYFPIVTLRQPGAVLMLSTQPAGASVRIDGQLQAQHTPAAITLKPGSYVVAVEKDGHSEMQRVEMTDRVVFLRIPLEPPGDR